MEKPLTGNFRADEEAVASRNTNARADIRASARRCTWRRRMSPTGEEIESSRARRRWISHRHEVELCAHGQGCAASEIPGCKRRRNGAGHF